MTVQKAATTGLARTLAGANVEGPADKTGRNATHLIPSGQAVSTNGEIGWGACLVQG